MQSGGWKIPYYWRTNCSVAGRAFVISREHHATGIPSRNLSDTQPAELDLPDSRELEEDDFDLEMEYRSGPLYIKGLYWVGKTSVCVT